MKEKILVSSCLMGVPCRWHGKKLTKSSYIKKLEKQNEKNLFCQTEKIELILACPETLGGLSVPRKPVKRYPRGTGRVFETCADKEKRKDVTGIERTKEFQSGAMKTLEICKNHNIKKAILCQWSPSCDKTGITGKLLIKNGIEIINIF